MLTDCPGFNFRRQCAHSIACKWAAEEAREAACRPKLEDLMDAWIDDRTGTVAAF